MFNNGTFNGNVAGGNYYDNCNINIQKRTVINKQQASQKVYKEPKTFRPKLKDNDGKNVICYGFLIRKRDDGRYTVINIVDEEGKYMGDHVTIDMKEYVYDYKDELYDFRFIKFSGLVKRYTRKNGTTDYEVDLKHKPVFIDDSYYTPLLIEEIDEFINSGYNEDKINKFIRKTATTRDMQDIIMELVKRINELTKFDFGNNFITSYIINTFMLNRATYDLYEGNMRSLICSNNALMDIVYIMSGILFNLKTIKNFNGWKLKDILETITDWCNIFQNVTDYSHDKNFKKYCKNNLNIEKDKELNKAYDVLLNRKRNFGYETNSTGIEIHEILDMSYYILNEIIK